MGKALFAEEPDSFYRLLAAVVTAAVLLFVDSRTDWLQPVRATLAHVTEPMVAAADLPRSIINGTVDLLQTRASLADDNARLRQENLVLQRHVQQLAALTAENARLRELLNSSALLDSSVLVAEIIAFDPDPSRVEVVIDKGANAGLYVGQPMLDASGIIGQVIGVGPGQARVILIADRRHGVPVEVTRNGVRSIAQGTGRAGVLQLQYLPVTADVRVGDLLVSSGLGGVFPRGYPVGRITAIEKDPGATFMTVSATPSAAVGQSRHVLVVFEQEAELQQTLLQKAAVPAAPAAATVPVAGPAGTTPAGVPGVPGAPSSSSAVPAASPAPAASTGGSR